MRHSVYGDPQQPVISVFNPEGADDWSALIPLVAGPVLDEAHGTVEHILNTVRSRDCRTIVLEHRYLDPDYRSEYSAFWSGRFEDRPPQAKRAHFFSSELDAVEIPQMDRLDGYLGYCVIRPTELGAIGRTVIAPPRGLQAARYTRVVERPSLCGHPLEVCGVPFCQQDGELLRCAHAAAWVCHYVAFHHRVVGRRLTAEIAALPSFESSKHRPLPSTGLTGEQLQGVFSTIGIPAFFYEVDRLAKLPADLPSREGESAQEKSDRVMDERIFRVVCKYLNSGFPVVVLTESDNGNHAFTLVGWQSTPDASVRLIACDDRVGPYETIDSPTTDGKLRGRWRGFMLPLPSKVFLTGEAAETRARQMAKAQASDELRDRSDPGLGDLGELAARLNPLGAGISVRSRLIEGRRYKAVAARQGRDPEALRVIRMAHLPHWVWVVEFQDSKMRDGDHTCPCVLAEVVFDSTSHDERPAVKLVSTVSATLEPDRVESIPRDGESPPGFARTDDRRWRSMVSDPSLSDREYGGTLADEAPPGSPAVEPN